MSVPAAVTGFVTMGYNVTVSGSSFNSSLVTQLTDAYRCALSGANLQIYSSTLTLAPSATTTLDLTTGLFNPLNDAISGSGQKFTKIWAVMIQHDPASLATSGITAFGAGANEFQGPYAAASVVTMKVGLANGFILDFSKTPYTVDGTHKLIPIINLDATALHTATVNVFIAGGTN